MDNKIKHIFRREEINVRLTRKIKTLGNILRKKGENNTCKLKNCAIKDPKLCFRRNAVYEVKCDKCHQIYIGSTIRPLHIRIREHLNTSRSSIFHHKITCKNKKFNIKILTTADDEPNLRLKEFIFIRKLKPSINK